MLHKPKFLEASQQHGSCTWSPLGTLPWGISWAHLLVFPPCSAVETSLGWGHGWSYHKLSPGGTVKTLSYSKCHVWSEMCGNSLPGLRCGYLRAVLILTASPCQFFIFNDPEHTGFSRLSPQLCSYRQCNAGTVRAALSPVRFLSSDWPYPAYPLAGWDSLSLNSSGKESHRGAHFALEQFPKSDRSAPSPACILEYQVFWGILWNTADIPSGRWHSFLSDTCVLSTLTDHSRQQYKLTCL